MQHYPSPTQNALLGYITDRIKTEVKELWPFAFNDCFFGSTKRYQIWLDWNDTLFVFSIMKDNSIEINRIEISEELRQQGITKRLLKILKEACKLEKTTLIVRNARNKQFWTYYQTVHGGVVIR